MDSLVAIFLAILSALCWLVALLDKRTWPLIRGLAPFAIIWLGVYAGMVLYATESSYGDNNIHVGPWVAPVMVAGFIVFVVGWTSRLKPSGGGLTT